MEMENITKHMITVPVEVDDTLVDEEDLKIHAKDFVSSLKNIKGVRKATSKIWMDVS